jgi:two-component system alkaline phosphatase synthesis response regulator PhoP
MTNAIPRILVVDDEQDVLDLLVYNLRKAHYEVTTATNGRQALDLARQEEPDLSLLDLMLPEVDGLDVCRELRHTSKVPIIMITARGEEVDRVVGLELGADDYVTKPFSPREVVARVRSVLRRTKREGPPPGLIRVGELVIDLTNRNVMVGGRPVSLTPIEFDLLAALARVPGRPLTRVQLINQVYDVAYDGFDRAIDSHIKNLRRKIEPDAPEPRYILTVYGVGYKLGEETP